MSNKEVEGRRRGLKRQREGGEEWRDRGKEERIGEIEGRSKGMER